MFLDCEALSITVVDRRKLRTRARPRFPPAEASCQPLDRDVAVAFRVTFGQRAFISVIVFNRPVEKRDRDDMSQPRSSDFSASWSCHTCYLVKSRRR